MKLDTSVYIDILESNLKFAFTEKLNVNGIKVSKYISRYKIGLSQYAVIEVDKASDMAELTSRYQGHILIFITPEINYSLPVINQIKKPCSLNAVYERLLKVYKITVIEENQNKNDFDFTKKIRKSDQTEYVLERVFANRTLRYIRTKFHKEIRLTDHEFNLFMELSKQGTMTKKQADEFLYGQSSLFSPLDDVIASLWIRIRSIKFLIIEYDKQTITLRLRNDYKERVPKAQKFHPSFSRSRLD
jgi:hypothetical protein